MEFNCEMCNGPHQLLGFLGNLAHFRCRNCGWMENREVNPDDLPEDDDNED